MKPAAVAAIAVVAALAAGTTASFIYDARPRCDSPGTIATLKEMAADKVRSYDGAQYFLRNTLSADRQNILMTNNEVVFSVSAFRDRGAFGGKGTSCAAQINVYTQGQTGKAEFSTEYTVEPASGGETMVSARFMPN